MSLFQEMEKERKRKEEEELKQKQLEEDRKTKAEMEVRRKEEENVNALVELERKKSIKKQEEMNEENRLLREQIEQERRDHELALRLARESKGGIDDAIIPMSSPVPKMAEVASKVSSTGKSLSEALIFATTNPQYDDRLFIELQVQYMKIPSSNLGRTCCVQKLFLIFRIIFVLPMFCKKKSF